MGRFIAPILAFLAAGYIYTQNQGATNEFVFLFPMNNIFEDPAVAGERSWQALLVIGVLWLISDLRSLFQKKPVEQPSADE